MKIYHTKTQEDYDALMRELEREGYKTFKSNFFDDDKYCCVIQKEGRIYHCNYAYCELNYPDIFIIEYKAPKTRVERNSVKDLVKEVSKDNKEMYHAIIQELEQTYIAKNADYDNSFEQSLDKRGRVAGLVRIEDKLNRANNLSEGAKQNVIDESEQDTYLDMANYCIMMAMWLKKQANE